MSYADATPGLTNAYDRLGRQVAVTNGAAVCTWTYNDVGEPLTETYTGGVLAGLAITNNYDKLLRRTSLTLLSPNSQLLTSTKYSYDAGSRLATVSDGTNSASYSYLANSPLVGQIAFANNGAVRMTTIKTYDLLNRLTGIVSSTNAVFNYGYNSANQRTAVTNLDSSHWVYQYDNLGQVISGKRWIADRLQMGSWTYVSNLMREKT